MKKDYIIPSSHTAEMCFQGVMAGTVTGTGGGDVGYDGGGHGGGHGKERYGYEEAEDLLQSTEGSEETVYSLW